MENDARHVRVWAVVDIVCDASESAGKTLRQRDVVLLSDRILDLRVAHDQWGQRRRGLLVDVTV